METEQHHEYTIEDIDHCIATLTHLVNHSERFIAFSKEKQVELIKIAGQLSRPDRYQLKQRNKAIRKVKRQAIVKRERKARAATGIRRARQTAVFSAPLQITDDSKQDLALDSPRNCYVCKSEFTRLHFFYDTMCPECAAFNYQKRFQTADLKGQVALITGSRLKIGYQAALMMLRAGATVVATTRFPVDSALRYAGDTGWVTDEDPAQLFKRKEDLHDFQPPLDILDGAARVCDPFFDGINTGKHWCGQFLKDYFPIDW